MGTVVEFADLAAALIGRDVAARTATGRARELIGTIIERRQFHPVFQPIVDLRTNAIVGFEALTRFDDGCRQTCDSTKPPRSGWASISRP